MERKFKGIWIPAEIWLDKNLTLIEKVFLVEIDSLDNEKGCFANNQYFANFFGLSKTRVSIIIRNLIDKDAITSEIIYKEGTKQILKRVLKVCYIPYLTKVKDPIKEKLKDNNTINNTINKNNIEERKTEFKNSLLPYLNDFGKDMLNDFFLYWTEHGAKDKKMRFEKEKSFGLSRRLGTWKKNSKKYDTPTNENISIMDKVNAKLGL